MSVDRETSVKVVIERAVRQMSPELRERYIALRRTLATVTASEVRARYQIGQAVLEIKHSEDRYGARAVPLLAEALARTESTLYRYASVAEAWPGQTIEEILERRLPGGEPLSWCHLLTVAAAPLDQRERLLREVVQRGLSVRALSKLVLGGRVDHATHEPPTPLPYARLRRLVAACASVERFVVDDAFVERALLGAPPEAAETIATALEAQVRAIRHLERNVARLRKAGADLRRRSQDLTRDAPRRSGARIEDRPYPRLLVGAAS